MLEAYYRTDIEALGVYGTLSGEFAVPNPDPTWPTDGLILIDAKTGEILITHGLHDDFVVNVTTPSPTP
jgi:hypothetical protein